MTTIYDILTHFRSLALSQKEVGTQFERLMQAWLQTDTRYAELFEHVWLWEQFPSRKDFGGKDTGIDLVAKTHEGDYWAIQCKCYAEDATIDKPAVDSFLATSSRSFMDETSLQTTTFAHRLWISTTNKWGPNAEEAIQNQTPPLSRVHLYDLDHSAVDWQKLFDGLQGKEALAEKKQLRKHQREALAAAHTYYHTHDRGKLVMACGTGKTFTSLKLIEQETSGQGLILFLVPSIALLGQSLNDWHADAEHPLKAICICSDSRATRKTRRGGDDDESSDSIVDLALPATTNARSILQQFRATRNHEGLTVVFSTYQSIDVIAEAQSAMLEETGGSYGTFDFIVCDEAHRTTGVKLAHKDESHFTKVHSDDFIKGRKRLYMTATPRLYGENAKIKASRADCILCSMDDPTLYGEEFYRVNFSYAVQNGILTDYKVLVLTVSESMIPEELMTKVRDKSLKELNYDDTGRLIGVINGLSKMILGDNGVTWQADPRLMRRALAFTHKIGRIDDPGSSKNIAHILPKISAEYNATLTPEEQQRVVTVEARHVDGSMGAAERNEALAWLSEETHDANTCRVISNVRCLSEGVDVPALDAVLFLSARNSQVDVVQSVGRVMRSFHKGQSDEKRYGYIIIPVIVPEGTKPEEALSDNTAFKVVWDILNALRSHDDHFNAHVNTIALNRDKGSKVTVGVPGLGQTGVASATTSGDANDNYDAQQLSSQEISKRLELQFGDLQQEIYAKLVEKCGDRLYWENWAGEVGEIAKKYIARIERLVNSSDNHTDKPELSEEFDKFVTTLQRNLNPGITQSECIEMLAQHIITRPVFDALFSEYQFISNNSISSSMQRMIELLEEQAVDKDLGVLDKFYDSVRTNVGHIDNLEGKQTVIKNLYEKFFKGAFPLTVERLGTVYTPVECVDFIIHSVEDLLRREFGSSLTREGVHILDPFTGTGTFITRLLQSGVIKPADMLRKYQQEIHANELMLLAYYIADVNIESVFQEVCPQEEYLRFDGLCLTDTFLMSEETETEFFPEYFNANTKEVEAQRETPIRVIIGNPPYSIGQKSANDNAQNQSYPKLESRIGETYGAKSIAANTKGLYDSYIKAYRWASDRLPKEEGGIIAFISNGAWIDGNSHDGFRASLYEEFDKIYVYNLRGNARTQGELRKREGGGIFDSGSRTPIAITFLVRYPEGRRRPKAEIYYHDIGDYLSREDKLSLIREAGTYSRLKWTSITPNEKHDWINQRDGLFDTLIPIAPEKKLDPKAQSMFYTYSLGIATSRDPFLYNFSLPELKENTEITINYYNKQRELIRNNPKYNVIRDPKKIVWNEMFQTSAERNSIIELKNDRLTVGIYRPFCKQNLLYQKNLIQRTYQQLTLFPTPHHKNLCICVSGKGSSKGFSSLITDYIPSLDYVDKTQCFPLYYYEEDRRPKQKSLFDEEVMGEKYIRREAITRWFMDELKWRYGKATSLTREDAFYYLYGLLHSADYRARFEDDLRKSLPRIPIVSRLEDFLIISKAGRKLAELHLGYEGYPAPEGVEVVMHTTPPAEGSAEEYDYYRVEKMRFPKKGEQHSIIYNSHITITGIPEEAYAYIVNGKSAIEWIMERYAVTIDKKSGIKNDPNLWSREHQEPRYVLDLLLSIIHVSVATQEIVAQLPRMTFEPADIIELPFKIDTF